VAIWKNWIQARKLGSISLKRRELKTVTIIECLSGDAYKLHNELSFGTEINDLE